MLQSSKLQFRGCASKVAVSAAQAAALSAQKKEHRDMKIKKMNL